MVRIELYVNNQWGDPGFQAFWDSTHGCTGRGVCAGILNNINIVIQSGKTNVMFDSNLSGNVFGTGTGTGGAIVDSAPYRVIVYKL